MYQKNFFNSDFSSPCFDVPKASNFTSGGVQNHDTKNRRLGTIVTSIQNSKPREKQISQSFSYCELINLLRNGTIVPCLWENKNVSEICFSRGLESWIDVTIVSSPLFLVSRFCTPTEVKFDAFGTSKQGKGKSLWNKTFLLHLAAHWGDLIEQIKKICHIHVKLEENRLLLENRLL